MYDQTLCQVHSQHCLQVIRRNNLRAIGQAQVSRIAELGIANGWMSCQVNEKQNLKITAQTSPTGVISPMMKLLSQFEHVDSATPLARRLNTESACISHRGANLRRWENFRGNCPASIDRSTTRLQLALKRRGAPSLE